MVAIVLIFNYINIYKLFLYIRANLIKIQNLSLIEFPDNGVSQIGKTGK